MVSSADGEVTWREIIGAGLENTPKPFIGLFTGENAGQKLVGLGAKPPGRLPDVALDERLGGEFGSCVRLSAAAQCPARRPWQGD